MLRLLLLACGVVGVPLQQNKAFEWGYHGHNGPFYWGNYYPECKKISQSPIVLPNYFDDHHFLRRIEYHDFDLDCDLELYNDGKSVTLVVKDDGVTARPSISGSVLNPKSRYLLERIILRTGHEGCMGSEHGMDGVYYDGEMQWYFYDEKFKSFEEASKSPGAIAVVSQILSASKEDNKFFDCIVDNVDKISGSKVPYSVKWLQLPELLPKYSEDKKGNKECVNCDYYFYEGSLNYPPCTEVALWHVYMDTVHISEHQLEKIRNVISWQSGDKVEGNKRTPQPINFREVLQHRERSFEAYQDHPNLPPKQPENMPPFPQFPGADMHPHPPPYPGSLPVADSKVDPNAIPDYFQMPPIPNMPHSGQQYPPQQYPPQNQQYPEQYPQQYPPQGQQYPPRYPPQQYPPNARDERFFMMPPMDGNSVFGGNFFAGPMEALNMIPQLNVELTEASGDEE